MKILYDYQAFFMQRFGGVSNCFVQLISHLPQNIQYEIAIRESNNIHLKNSGLKQTVPIKLTEDNFISTKKFKGRGFLFRRFNTIFPRFTSEGRNRQCSIEAIKKGDFDVFHPTFFGDYFFPYLINKPYILTVHDMIPERFWANRKKDEQLNNKPKLCNSAAHIIAVSEKTKQDLIEILHVPESKITVIYHGAPQKIDVSKEPPIVKSNYILYVGQRDIYKYFKEMLEQLSPFFARHPGIKLVCTGKSFSKKEILFIQQLGLEYSILNVHPTDHEMTNLYSNALCFIYPSIYEGFGIPILEAYQANCPVLLNHKSCFPEIAKDAALYFHLDEQQSDLLEVMEQFVVMPKQELEKLLERQNARLNFFSWKDSANKLADIYESIK